MYVCIYSAVSIVSGYCCSV